MCDCFREEGSEGLGEGVKPFATETFELAGEGVWKLRVGLRGEKDFGAITE